MPKWDYQWEVPSDTSGRIYKVSMSRYGEWACSCPRWIYHRERCKHIQYVQSKQEVQDLVKTL